MLMQAAMDSRLQLIFSSANIFSFCLQQPIVLHSVPEIIDPVFAKTSTKRSFCMTKNERFWLVFVKTGSINSGTGQRISFRAETSEGMYSVFQPELKVKLKNGG